MMAYKTFILIVFLFSIMGFASAFEFNGTVYDVNGVALNNTVINITIRNSAFSVVAYNFTTTNASGWFNMTVGEVANGFYEPRITWRNSSTNSIEWVGQSLPSFPEEMLVQVAGTSFYLKQAGTLNITAINSTAGRISFRYQIKDQKLGYSIASNFDTSVSEASVVVPRGRNYSMMIYPDQSMPVSYNWNNFTASESYNISTLSRYNFTTKMIHYQFNTTMNIVRVSGYMNYSGISGWNTFTVVPYLLEPGNMVHSNFGDMPYNISGFSGGTDIHNLTSGFYNISLPSTPAETSNILLFATARNGSGYYGGFKNLTNLGSGGLNQFNFSAMSGLFGSPANISMEDVSGGQVNITTAKQTFNLVNLSNASLSQANVHAEVTVDYSNYGLQLGEFTWMVDSAQGSAAQLSLPLINVTGVKEINVFAGGGDYAPKRLSPSVSNIITNTLGGLYNITLSSFDPGDIGGTLSSSNIFMGLTFSNSTCSVPLGTGFPESCFIGGLGGSQTTMESFNPMQAVMGGATLNFIMGKTDSSNNLDLGIIYVNVDMIASGPPDAAFDSSVTESTGGGFSGAARFGSAGPTIYDYVLVGLPYSTSAGSGLNDTGDVNISIPNFYDDNWNLIWNVTANGTNTGALAGNYSHYSARQGEWSYLLNGTTCHTNSSAINVTNPCYIDRSNDMVWVRLPHFSGTGPQISGAVISTSSSSSSSSSTSESGRSGVTSFWTTTFSEDNAELSVKGIVMRVLGIAQRVTLKIGGEQHTVGIVGLTGNTATINVSSTSRQKTLSIGEEWKVDVNSGGFYNLLVKLNSISSNKANISMQAINEQIAQPDLEEDSVEQPSTKEPVKERKSWIVVLLVIIMVIIVLAMAYKFKNKFRR